MSHNPPPTREEFARWVQDALHRLYDSPYLRSHPLAELLAGPETGVLQRGQQLRRILLDAIHALCPAEGTPAQSSDWRAYRLLELRYIEGLAPAEIMKQLAFGRSYYFREQARLLEALTAALWEQWQQSHVALTGPDDGLAEQTASLTREQLAQAETERLFAQATWEPVDAVQLLDSLRTPIETLAHAQGVAVSFGAARPPTVLHADRVLLRQAVLNVIAYALDLAPGGRLEISGFTAEGETGIQVRATQPQPATAPGAGVHSPALTNPDPSRMAGSAQRQGLGLDICRRFMSAMGGALHVEPSAAEWVARLAWPAARPQVLLVIDDNTDFADLFRRYLAGHGWQVIGAPGGAEARQVLDEIRPTVIALDIMMPREDGWEILATLRADERSRDIPIVICSVLNEPRLAQALGANAYLTKPVTQEGLLRALEQVQC